MRKRIAFRGACLVLAILLGTVALPASRAAQGTHADLVAAAANVGATAAGPITLQRLLHSRMDWMLRVTKALAALDTGSVPAQNGTHTIIDEPDPIGDEDSEDPANSRPHTENQRHDNEEEGDGDRDYHPADTFH